MINPPHPGESVRECIDEAGMTIKECALQIEVTPNNMYRLVNGHIGISPKVALGLEALGWSNAEFWMRLQAQYDLLSSVLRTWLRKSTPQRLRLSSGN